MSRILGLDVSTKTIGISLFEDFGDNALHFQIFFAVNSSFESNIVKSDMRYSIFRAFQKEGIQIPFPQRTISFLNPPKALQ